MYSEIQIQMILVLFFELFEKCTRELSPDLGLLHGHGASRQTIDLLACFGLIQETRETWRKPYTGRTSKFTLKGPKWSRN